MDCARFAEIAIDGLYDELDEQTASAARRHADGCQRCHAAMASLRSARRSLAMPAVVVAPNVTERIFASARRARDGRTWTRRLAELVARAGAYTMRPQVTMGALLLLMLGSSLLLLRTRRGTPGARASRVSVTEHGAPEAEPAELRPAALPPAQPLGSAPPARREEERGRDTAQPAQSARAARGSASEPQPAAAQDAIDAGEPARAEPASDPYADAMALYKASRFADAAREFDLIASSSGRNAPMAALYAARSTQKTSGCGVAGSRYEAVAERFPGTAAAGDALWAAAACQRAVGNFERAKDLYISLRTIAGYRDRAESEIANLTAALAGTSAPRKGAAGRSAKPGE